jgi:hypothetical protein
MPRISIKAIAIGLAVDIGGTFAADLLFVMLYAVVLVAQGVSETEMQDRMTADPTYWVASMILGLAFVAGGGYVTGRIAKESEMTHAALMAFASMLVGLLFLLGSEPMAVPDWYLPLSFGLTMPAGIAGGYVAARRRARLLQ